MASIHPSARIDQRAIILTNDLEIGADVTIHANAVVGFPNPDPTWFEDMRRTVTIGSGSTIYPGAVIYEGAAIGENVELQEYTTVGSITKIGARTRVLYKAQVYHNVVIAEDCVIGALVANNVNVGRGCSVFGPLVHRYEVNDPTQWEVRDEDGPTLEDNVLVAMGAVVVGPVRLGSNSQVRPNVVVKHDVPRGEVIRNENRGPG